MTVFVPLTRQQRRLWLLHTLQPESAAYNVATALRFRGNLDIEALQEAWEAVVGRHESLRSQLVFQDGNVHLEVGQADAVPLRVADAVEPTKDVEALVTGVALHPFRVGEPLVRAELLRRGLGESVLVVTADHLVFDGWSAGIVVEELLDAYVEGVAALAARPPAPTLAELHALDEAESSVARRGRALEYWTERLRDAPYFALQPDRRQPDVPRHSARRAHAVVSERTFSSVRTLAATARTTSGSVLFAAFACLLGRLGAQEDIVVGMPVVDRQFRGTEHAVGFFTTTLPVRVEARTDVSFSWLVAEVARRGAEAYAHSHVAFDEIVAELKPVREPGRNPLFSVWFNVLPVRRIRGVPGLDVEDLTPPTLAALFDVGLYCTVRGDSASLSLVVDDDLFESWRAPAMLAALTNLLDRLVAAPDEPVGSHALPPAPAASAPSVSQAPGLLERIERVAARSPERVAVADSTREVSYRELLADARCTAWALQRRGVAPGDVVAISASRSASLPAAMLGVIGAGATLLLLDRNGLAERVAEYAARAGARHVLELEETAPAAPTPAGWPSAATSAAYIVVTSGTTGEPHAVRAGFDAVANFVDWHVSTFDLDEHDRFALISGIGHDPVFRDVFTPLCLGATLLVPDRVESSAPHDLLAWLYEQRITVLHAAPPVIRLLSAAAGGDEALPELTDVFLGGDVLTASDVANAHVLAPNARLVNFYGTTETPQAVSSFVAYDSAAGEDGVAELPVRVPIGPGVAGSELLVLAPGGVPAGVGELGEIHVRSRFLSDGYVGELELTAVRFSAVDADGLRSYATGDLGRPRLDGSFDFCGRRDRQHKVRGFRVECAEIERHLRRHPALADAWATVLRDEAGEHVAAYAITSDADVPPTAEDVRAFSSSVLPDYMVPSRVAVVQVLPTTANGKVDTAPLRAVGLADATAVVASDEVDDIVRRVWQQVIGARSIDVDANFFDLGGNSLTLITARELLQRQLGREIPLLLLFNKTTIRSLASAIRVEEAGERRDPSARPGLERQHRTAARRRRVEARRAFQPKR